MQSTALSVKVEQDRPMRLSGEFTCEAGQLVALVGPSGAGKTSMLRVLAGLMPPAKAHVQVGEEVWCDTQAGVFVPTPQRHVLKAEHAHQRLLLVVQGLKKLYADEHFVNLLRAEGLDTLPKYLAERIDNLNGATV